MKPVRSLAKYLAGLGYGSRKDMEAAIAHGRVTDKTGARFEPKPDWPDFVDHLSFDGELLDPPPGMILMLHKPTGYTCSRDDLGKLVYDLLPARFLARKPALSSIGRLDADTSGLLLFTDDGQLLHRLISPKSALSKVYEVTLTRPLEGHEAELFESGELMLHSETKPLAPRQAGSDRGARRPPHPHRRALSPSPPHVRRRRQSCRNPPSQPVRPPSPSATYQKPNGAS